MINNCIMQKKNILIVIGTRPEGIKMAPLYLEFVKNTTFNIKLCVTGQHKEMLNDVLSFFEVKPDFELNIMRPNQSLSNITANILLGLESVISEFKPDLILVHGDTSTCFAASLAAFYQQIKIFHIEAGLRTFNKYSPFPEEINRLLTSKLADYHFSPTTKSQGNLLNEGISKDKILVTGNTVVDALKLGLLKISGIDWANSCEVLKEIDYTKKIILVTGHRRENLGSGLNNICAAIKEIAMQRDDVEIVYPVHLNPNVQNQVYKELSGMANVKLIKPLDYPRFIWLMSKAYIIITDSGGIQEEAPSLKIPVLVTRNETERTEAIEAGIAILVGTTIESIKTSVYQLLNDKSYYESIANIENPFGKGNACEEIVKMTNQILK
jgi:UDP-N-acetylglucosamine 2-epimerase (non-hydrolysing)